MATRKSDPTLTITASGLAELLRPVLPLAGRDDMLPVLCAVKIETRDGHVIATATDRYRVGICRRENGSPAGFSAVVPLSTLKTIQSTFKKTRSGADPELDLTVESANGSHLSSLRVEQSNGTLSDVFEEASFKLPLVDGTFPDAVPIFTKALDAAEGTSGPVGLNPKYLADFRHAPDNRGAPLVVQAGASARKPILVFAGEHFIGAQMPVRLDLDSKHPQVDRDSWSKFLAPEPKPKKKPAAKGTAKKKSTKKAVA